MGQELSETTGLASDFQKSMRIHERRVYSKEFLLSVAELEDCKRLPDGLEPTLLRDVQGKSADRGIAIPEASSRGLIRAKRDSDAHSESPPDVPEWRRPSSLPGSPFLKNAPRQGDPSISSPRLGSARGGNNPARSIMGRSGSARWDLRSSGTDKERETNRGQYECDSTSTESGGRLHGKGLARSVLVAQEHDGLLGSGGPIVHRGMIQTPTSDRHRGLERTSRTGRVGEQYHSTRGGKVSRNLHVSQNSRREDSDSISNETFGSDDWPNGERSEQERQRRDRFEQMRIELRKKPLNTARNLNDNWFEESRQNTESLLSSSPGTPQSSSSKDDVLKPLNKSLATSSTPRLLVPPGFSKPAFQKTGSPKENHVASKTISDDDIHAAKQTDQNNDSKPDKCEGLTSLLAEMNQVKDNNQETSSPMQSPMMSKFARWFPSQESNTKESDLTSGNQLTKIKDMELDSDSSLVIPKDTEVPVVSKLSSVTSLMPINSQGFVLSMPVGPSLEDVEKGLTAGADPARAARSNEDWVSDKENCVLSEDHSLVSSHHAVRGDIPLFPQALQPERHSSKVLPEKKMPPVFLTCEDLEQSLLAETVHSIGTEKQGVDNSINLMQLLQRGSQREDTIQQSQAVEKDTNGRTDGSASLHIMSLLQKKTNDPTKTSPLVDVMSSTFPGERSVYLAEHVHTAEDFGERETQSSTTEIISLETLFGKGFVNELRSLGEPVSSKQLMEDSVQIGKASPSVDLALASSQPTRGSEDATDAGFVQVGWKFDSHHSKAKDSQESDLQCKDFWSDTSSHGQASRNTSKNPLSSRGSSMNGWMANDLKHAKPSPHFSHHANFGHGQHHEGHHFSTSSLPSQRVPFEPLQESRFIRDSALHGMGMYPSNSPYHPGFFQAPNHTPVVRGQYRMPTVFPLEYPESVQMGFNLGHSIPDPISRINPSGDEWFTGDTVQTSQGLGAFSRYQHQVPSMIQERSPGYGVSGPGAKNYMGLPSDKLVQSETHQLPFAPGLDPYMLTRSRQDYG